MGLSFVVNVKAAQAALQSAHVANAADWLTRLA